MSLEQKIEALTVAVAALTAAMGSATPATTGGASTGKTKPAKEEAKGYTPKYTVEQMQAALSELKDKAGAPVAKGIVKEVGGKDKMAEITDPETVDKVYEAAKAKLKAHEDDV